jgi:C-terminal processing protease CtpA/Prc
MNNKLFKKQIKIGFVSFIFLSLFHLTVFSQYNVYVNVDSVIQCFYQLRTDNVLLQNGYFFSNLFPDEPNLYDGMEICKKNKKYIWKKQFKKPIRDHFEYMCLNFRFYCTNVDSIRICIDIKNGKNIYSTIKIQENGYQIPFISKLKSWTKYYDSIDTINVSAISIVGFSKSKTSRLVIGDLQLYSQKNVKKTVHDPFFDELLGGNSFDNVSANSFSFNYWPFLYIPFSFYLQMNRIHANSETFVSICDSVHKKNQLLYKFMYFSLKKYPYYEEYQTDTTFLFERINSWKSIHYTSLIDSFSLLIANIGDPHFRFNKQRKNIVSKLSNNKQNPVRFAILNNRVYVAAVQNKGLTSIQIGDELLSYNGVEAKSLIKYNYTKDNINRLIPISLKDDTHLTLLRGKDTLHTHLVYLTGNKPLYTISHRKYTCENGIHYYKLNNWEPTEYFHFQNLFLKNELKRSKKIKCIILDLRNNGGGDEIAAAKIASCFITTPQPFCHYSYTFLNNETIMDSWVISANPVLNLENIPVIVLTNRYTACASESFISFLKQHHYSTTVISNDSQTSGAYSGPFVISIFGDALLRIPYMKHYDSNGNIIEKRGIAPDVYVHFKEIRDLAANQDKVLQTAYKIAQSLNDK